MTDPKNRRSIHDVGSGDTVSQIANGVVLAELGRRGMHYRLESEGRQYTLVLGQRRVRVLGKRKPRGDVPDEAARRCVDTVILVDFTFDEERPDFYIERVHPGERVRFGPESKNAWHILVATNRAGAVAG